MTLRLVVLTAVLFLFSIPVLGQTRRGTEFYDPASLRAAFLAAFGSDFELVRDTVNSRTKEQGGRTFWLAYVKPAGTGYFNLQYSFKRNDQHYSHEERKIFFTVAPKGCRRGPPSYGVYSRFCLGDTIVVPVVLSGASGHEFKLTKQSLGDDRDLRSFRERYPESGDNRLDKAPVANPSESLRYVGHSADKAFHHVRGYTLHLSAEFEAIKPGKFNLQVASSEQSAEADEAPPGSKALIVVDRETSLTLIAGRERVRGFNMGENGSEYESSTSENSYTTNLIILQPGDRLSVSYFSVRRDGEFERSMKDDPAEGTKPVISVHPFSLETRYDYSDWLVDYLP